MNFLTGGQSIFYNVSIVVVVLLFTVWFFWQRRYKLGFGMWLAWSYKLNCVVVLSRMKNSPAHKNGIQAGMRVESANGILLSTLNEFIAWQENVFPAAGVSEDWVLLGKHGKHVVKMVPAKVKKLFPEGPHPDDVPPGEAEREAFKRTLKWSEEVDAYIHTTRIRKIKIREAFNF